MAALARAEELLIPRAGMPRQASDQLSFLKARSRGAVESVPFFFLVSCPRLFSIVRPHDMRIGDQV